jgi:hypothetical protein
MTGNEILLNMMNVKHFRNSELVNAFFEFSKRVKLPENDELSNVKWTHHPYFKRVFQHVVWKMPSLNVLFF